MFKKRSVLAIIVSLIVVGTSTFGTLMYLDRRDYRNYLESQYQRNLFDLITNVDNLQASLSKAMVTASPKQSLILFGDVWRQASSAQDKINALPITQSAISNTSKFLSQVGDFSYTLLKSSNSGQNLSDGDWSNLRQLRNYSGYLMTQLNELGTDLTNGVIDWGEIKQQGTAMFEKNQNNVNTKFQFMSTQLQQYPTLIYDGPFSENMLNIKPRVLSGKQISLIDAKKIVAKLAGKSKVENITEYSNKSGELIPAYALSVKLQGRKNADINIDISKNGGHIIYMLDSRNVQNSSISVKKASQIGSKFLKSIGYKNMIPIYSLKYDNEAVINYAAVQDKVVIYPDQIKLKIALDNGDIVGIESQHYLIAHQNRIISKPKITVDEAMKNVSKRLNIRNIRLTVIPLESQKEVLCYEFYGDYDGEKFLVYINAINGAEEKILKIVNTPDGELTM